MLAFVVLLACALPFAAQADEADFAKERKALLAELQRDAAATAASTGRSRFSAGVVAAIESVPRERFVPSRLVDDAYENRPFPIGHGQTISQPCIVAPMTELPDVARDD